MDTSLDEALLRIAELSPEYADELSDHAPMVVEALDRLGQESLIGPYLDKTMPRRRPKGLEANPALATFESLAARAHHDILQGGWSAALGSWLARLAPGLSGAAFHGTIRVGHAARALTRADTEPRQFELARALAYAAVRGEELPRASATGRASRSLVEVLDELEPSHDALADRYGLISTALAERAGLHPTLAARIAELRLPPASDAANELCEAAIRMFLHADYLPMNTFTMLHAITGMEAIRTLVTVCPTQGPALVEHGAHALAAMRVAFVGAWQRPCSAGQVAADTGGVERAVSSLDDHAIKLAAAMEAYPVDDEQRAQALGRWLSRI